MRLAIILGALVLSVSIAFAGQKQGSLTAEQKKLAALEKAYVQAKTAYAKNPKDGAAKKKLVACATTYADTVLVSPALKPTDKYPKALSLYREILRLDPKNKNAASNRDLIESIYKSMGRPIPKG
jgi:tetratricopeptide (TPR) repeat protein